MITNYKPMSISFLSANKAASTLHFMKPWDGGDHIVRAGSMGRL